MAFDESLAARVRGLLGRAKGLEEKKMFGGTGFLLNGNMAVGVWKEFLIVRVGPDAYDESLAEPFAREFDITGRSMKGWVMVLSEGTAEDDDLERWVAKGTAFARSLPKK